MVHCVYTYCCMYDKLMKTSFRKSDQIQNLSVGIGDWAKPRWIQGLNPQCAGSLKLKFFAQLTLTVNFIRNFVYKRSEWARNTVSRPACRLWGMHPNRRHDFKDYCERCILTSRAIDNNTLIFHLTLFVPNSLLSLLDGVFRSQHY